MYAEKLPVLKDDTKDIIEYNKSSNNKKKKSEYESWSPKD